MLFWSNFLHQQSLIFFIFLIISANSSTLTAKRVDFRSNSIAKTSLRPLNSFPLNMGTTLHTADSSKGKTGLFHTLGGTSKFLVSGAASSVLLASSGKGSWIPTYYISGAILNGILSKILKKYIRQPRPEGSHRGGYGMPSSHTQSFFYFLTAVALNSHRILSRLQGYALVSFLSVYALVASYWRVHTGIHSFAQIFVGAILGVITALITWHYEDGFIGTHASILLPATVPIVLKLVVITLVALVVGKKEVVGIIKILIKKKYADNDKDNKDR